MIYGITLSRSCIFLFLLIVCRLVQAAEIHVPADFPTIQEGLSAAQSGDSVIVAAGVYQENIIWPTIDGIRLSGEDPNATIVRGDGSARCLSCTHPCSITLHIENLIFENGGDLQYGFFGGGVFVENSNFSIENCWFRNNESGMGSLAVRNSVYYIRQCRFTGNTAAPMQSETGGAGLYAEGSGLATECSFEGNTILYGDGSGAFIKGDSVIDRCTFKDNQREYSDSLGGALAIGYGNTIVQNCIFIENSGPASALLILGSCEVINNLFVDNQGESENFGGTIVVGVSASIRFNTFTDNTNASLFFLSTGNESDVHHNILDKSVEYLGGSEPNTVSFHHNDYWPAALPDAPGEGEFRASPQFVQGALGGCYLSQVSAGQPGTSPCVDAGMAAATPPDGTTATNEIPDTALPDIGYHYPFSDPPPPPETPTPEMTPVPSDCTEPGVTIEMPAKLYHEGDVCWCDVMICNPDQNAYEDIPLFVVLDVYGAFYFAPGWSPFDYILTTVQPGLSRREVIPPFYWPSGAGNVETAVCYSAMTNPQMTELLGRMDTWIFSWN